MQPSLTNLMERPPNISSLLLGLIITTCFTAQWLLTRNAVPCEGLGDCVKYGQMAQSFLSGSFHAIDAPFNTRIAAPWIASLLTKNIEHGFLALNAISALIFNAA